MQYQVTEAAAVLSRTPATLRALLEGLPDSWLHSSEGPETWSPFQVAGHLVEAEEKLWIPRARWILSRGEDAAFEPFDRFAHLELYRDKAISEVLDRFQALRSESLDALSELDLTNERLNRKGRHPDFGAVTLGQLLGTWVVHDLAHLRQIARTMAKQYRDEVGPWAKYLRVLSE